MDYGERLRCLNKLGRICTFRIEGGSDYAFVERLVSSLDGASAKHLLQGWVAGKRSSGPVTEDYRTQAGYARFIGSERRSMYLREVCVGLGFHDAQSLLDRADNLQLSDMAVAYVCEGAARRGTQAAISTIGRAWMSNSHTPAVRHVTQAELDRDATAFAAEVFQLQDQGFRDVLLLEIVTWLVQKNEVHEAGLVAAKISGGEAKLAARESVDAAED